MYRRIVRRVKISPPPKRDPELRKKYGDYLLVGPTEKNELAQTGDVPRVRSRGEGATKRVPGIPTPGFTNLAQAVWGAQGSTIRTSDPVPREGPRDRDFADGTTVRWKE